MYGSGAPTEIELVDDCNSNSLDLMDNLYQPVRLIDNRDSEPVQLTDSHSNHNSHYSEPIDSHDSEPVQ